MTEIKSPLMFLAHGDSYTAPEDGAYIIGDRHTHSDILRFIIADIGKEDVASILQTIDEEE